MRFPKSLLFLLTFLSAFPAVSLRRLPEKKENNRNDVRQIPVHSGMITTQYKGERKMQSAPSSETRKTARLDVRVHPEVKKAIEQAAEVLGVSTTDFASATLVAAAHSVLERNQRILLNNADRDRFLQSLDAEEGPNEALTRAAQDFNKRYTR
jgi:uncharacterized protein (DUF1778 family)